MDKPTIKIIDVARRAGVSKGTVDRVIYNRGGVSKASEAAVKKAIEELGYEPNLYASLLASRQTRVIALLIPRFVPGMYWEKLSIGFEKGGEDVASLGIRTRTFLYDQYDPSTFNEAVEEMLASNPSGVVFQPVFSALSASLVERLSILSIPYVFVDTKLDVRGYLAYFGMPLYESGRLAAHLLTERRRKEDVDKVMIVRLIRDKAGLSDPTARRREGFSDFMAVHFPKAKLLPVFINPSDPEGIDRTLEDFLEENGPSRYVVMFSSRVHLLSSFLASHPDPERRVVGYDNLDGNMKLLHEGLADILIAQHPEEQCRMAVKVISDFLLLHKKPELIDNYMHMDILTRFNEDYY